MSHIVAYFVTRIVKDFLPAGDFKTVNKFAENLFRSGHVQNIQSVSMNNNIKSTCLPEMRKDCVYCVWMALESSSSDIIAYYIIIRGSGDENQEVISTTQVHLRGVGGGYYWHT